MNNPYNPPSAPVGDLPTDRLNNSGGGRHIEIPPGIKGWSWGAFFFNGIWAPFNRVWFGLLAFIPYAGLLVALYLGFKGRELAWRNKRWESIEHFNRVQRRWSQWVVVFLIFFIAIAVAVILPIFLGSTVRTPVEG